MTYRERRLAKAERLREWAGKHDNKSAAGFDAARKIADGIPMGQPILVGHHSEKRHRRDIGRIDSGMRKGIEEQATAQRQRSTADEIERQADRAIYDDDPDSVERLEEKVADLEAKRERMSRCNKLYRLATSTNKAPHEKAKAAELLAAEGFELERLVVEIAARYTWEQKGPFRPYELSNLGGVISKSRERIKYLRQRKAEEAATENAGGVLLTEHPSSYPDGPCYVRVRFAEKPERAILEALRGAGFHWSGGAWSGLKDKLPQVVADLVPVKENA